METALTGMAVPRLPIEAGTARWQGFKMPILCGPATQPENALHLGNQAQCSVLPPTERFDRLPLQLLPTLPALRIGLRAEPAVSHPAGPFALGLGACSRLPRRLRSAHSVC